MNLKERYEALVREIEAHEYRYYVLDSPVISDASFDALMRALRELEREHPPLCTPASPTQRVAGAPREHAQKVTHTQEMLSLDNVYTEEELSAFVARMQERLPGETLRFCVEPKLDGASVEALYRHGQLIEASTRGDGRVGEDITANVRTVRGVPLSIPYAGDVSVRGEVLLMPSDLLGLNAARVQQGLEPFANARNAAAGSMRMRDPRETRLRPLRILFYHLLEGASLHRTHSESLAWLASLGLPTERSFQVVDQRGLAEAIALLQKACKEIPFDTDGVVIKLDVYQQQKQLGSTAKSPRWAVAYKFQAERITTSLREVRVQVGRSGVLTPVAVLDPVQLHGTTIARASLHNAEWLDTMGLCVGDRVFLAKAGEVIPQVVEVDLSARLSSAQRFSMPTHCPSCKTRVTRKMRGHPEKGWESALRCPNLLCPAQIRAQIHHFTKRFAMNIEHLGVVLIDQLVTQGWVRNAADLYTLKREQLLLLERMGPKSADRILHSIALSRTRTWDRLLVGVGIPQLGNVAAHQLAEKVGSLETLLRWTPSQITDALQEIHGFGDKMIENVVLFVHSTESRALLEKLYRLGVSREQSLSRCAVQAPLAGQSFCVTGVFARPREEIHLALREAGGEIHTTVKRNTTFLIVGENPGSVKQEKANQHGTQILQEQDLDALLARIVTNIFSLHETEDWTLPLWKAARDRKKA